MITSTFSNNGVSLGEGSSNLTYLYGIGDFFQVLFEDTSIPNLLLEADTQIASDVYSKFLQLTSTLSLEDIQSTVGVSIQLALINSTDKVSGADSEEYVLPVSIQSSRFIANRPLAPTSLLEEDADFQINQSLKGVSTLKLARPLSEYPFPSRLLPDGTTIQYAVWFVDAALDERLLSRYYGNLIGVDPQNSDESFANFLYGLYYVYVKGPTLADIRRGLNLTLGIPLARAEETVVDIRTYLETDQYMVITDQFQYLIPYGLPPSVEVGDILTLGQELAEWVEIKDYLHDGEWWLNLYIPKAILPELPNGEIDRYADKGGWVDYIMRQYLRKHTFLVNIKVTTFSNVERFSRISQIIHRAKPSYTQPIYVWSVVATKEDTNFNLEDEAFSAGVTFKHEEHSAVPIQEMRRDNVTTTLRRGYAHFYRYQVPSSVEVLCGRDAYTSSAPHEFLGVAVKTYTNPVVQFRRNTREESAWSSAIMNRASDTWRGTRNQIGFRRDVLVEDPVSGTLWYGQGPGDLDSAQAIQWKDTKGGNGIRQVGLGQLFPREIRTRRVIPLYVTRKEDLDTKLALIGRNALQPWDWNVFLDFTTIRGDVVNGSPVNSIVVNGQTGVKLDLIYDSFFTRASRFQSLPSMIPLEETGTWLPARGNLRMGDGLAFLQVQCGVYGVYWLTFNSEIDVDPYHAAPSSDPVNITLQASMSRALSHLGSPLYMSRTRIGYNSESSPVNGSSVNAAVLNGGGSGQSVFEYSDLYNDASELTRTAPVFTQAIRNI